MAHFIIIFLIFFLLPLFCEIFYYKKYDIPKDYVLNCILGILFTDFFCYICFHYIFRIDTMNYSILHICIYALLNILFIFLYLFLFKNNNKVFINKIKFRIQKKSNAKWMVITYILLLISMMAVSYRMIYEPWIMVEDGKIFLNQQFQYGINAILNPYGGYLILISRLTAFISAHLGALTNSIIVSTMSMKWITVLFEIMIINYLNDDDFSWITSNRCLRLFFSLIILFMMGNFQFFFYNTTSSHWFCGLLCFIIGLNMLRGKMPKNYIMIFLLISILSSASSLLIGFAMIYYLFSNIDRKSIIIGTYKKIGKENFIKYLLMGVCLIIQAIFILRFSSSSSYQSSFGISTFFSTIVNSFILMLQTPLYALGVDVASHFNDIVVSSFIGILLFLTIGVILYKTKYLKLLCFSLISIAFLYFCVLYKNNDLQYYLYLFDNKYWLYNALPATMASFMFLLSLNEIFSIMKLKGLIVVYFIIFVFICQHLYFYSFEFTNQLWEIENKVDFSSSTYKKVEIFPGGEKWYLNVPVNDNN